MGYQHGGNDSRAVGLPGAAYQIGAQFDKARACIYDDGMIADQQFDASGIATIAEGVPPWNRVAATGTPEA
jgi:hypothetical protein